MLLANIVVSLPQKLGFHFPPTYKLQFNVNALRQTGCFGLYQELFLKFGVVTVVASLF